MQTVTRTFNGTGAVASSLKMLPIWQPIWLPIWQPRPLAEGDVEASIRNAVNISSSGYLLFRKEIVNVSYAITLLDFTPTASDTRENASDP